MPPCLTTSRATQASSGLPETPEKASEPPHWRASERVPSGSGVRAWAATCVTYGLVAAVVAIAAHARAGREAQSLTDQIEAAEHVSAKAKARLDELKPRLASAQVQLEASKAVTGQADWSALLALLSAQRGEAVVLRSCQLEPGPQAAASADKKPAGPTPAAPRGAAAAPLKFTLAGLGRSQEVVSDFVLRLEAVGLFDQITLLDTAREPFQDGSAVSFRLECALGAEREARPGPVGATLTSAEDRRSGS
jgi:hypothetical protein